MCWKSTSKMEEKVKFIRAWQAGYYTVTELCEDFGISRTTGHKLIRNYLDFGEQCFYEKSKRPYFIPHKTPIEIEKLIIKFRKKHKSWGARKISVLLSRKINQTHIPSVTTINNIFKRNGLVKPRKKRGHSIAKQYPKFDPQQPNEIWSADYKGKFKLGNKRYCHPLTVADTFSRKILCSKGQYYPTYKAAKQTLTRVFTQFGMPQYLHTDNGIPFASANSICRFSRLSYWLIDLGIVPVFSDPASPQQNGRHERMHRDLKASCAKPPEHTLTKQQQRMDRFVDEYNEVRPHEALDMKTPNQVHSNSTRKFLNRIPAWDYPYHMKKLKVTKCGSVRWGGYNWVFVSNAAIGRYLGFEELGNGIWKVYYRDINIGWFDEKLINHKEQHLKLSRKIV